MNSEIRNPKSERNPKAEDRRAKGREFPDCESFAARIAFSDFGFRASFGFRISDFGFRFELPPGFVSRNRFTSRATTSSSLVGITRIFTREFAVLIVDSSALAALFLS